MIAFTTAPFRAYYHAWTGTEESKKITDKVTFLVIAALTAVICPLAMDPDLESFRASIRDLFEEYPEASWYFSGLVFTLFYFGLCYVSSLYVDPPSPEQPASIPRSATDSMPPQQTPPPKQPAFVPQSATDQGPAQVTAPPPPFIPQSASDSGPPTTSASSSAYIPQQSASSSAPPAAQVDPPSPEQPAFIPQSATDMGPQTTAAAAPSIFLSSAPPTMQATSQSAQLEDSGSPSVTSQKKKVLKSLQKKKKKAHFDSYCIIKGETFRRETIHKGTYHIAVGQEYTSYALTRMLALSDEENPLPPLKKEEVDSLYVEIVGRNTKVQLGKYIITAYGLAENFVAQKLHSQLATREQEKLLEMVARSPTPSKALSILLQHNKNLSRKGALDNCITTLNRNTECLYLHLPLESRELDNLTTLFTTNRAQRGDLGWKVIGSTINTSLCHPDVIRCIIKYEHNPNIDRFYLHSQLQRTMFSFTQLKQTTPIMKYANALLGFQEDEFRLEIIYAPSPNEKSWRGRDCVLLAEKLTIIDRCTTAPNLSKGNQQTLLANYTLLQITIDYDNAISYCVEEALPRHLTLFTAQDACTVGAGMSAIHNDQRPFNTCLWRPLIDVATRAQNYAMAALQPFLPQVVIKASFEYIYPYMMIYGNVKKIQRVLAKRACLSEFGMHTLQPDKTGRRFNKQGKELTLNYINITHLIFEYSELTIPYHPTLQDEE